MKHKLILCLALVLSGGLFAGCSDKTDEHIESVKLPSGEILENHTYCESGFPDGVRFNELFLKNPAIGTSERVDSNGNLDYGYGSSLLELFPHPQEFIYGDEKVLVVGSYLCQRIIFNNVPYWNITSIDLDTEAQAYLKSFLPTNDILVKSPNDIGWVGNNVPFLFDSLDLTNNILILKKQMPKGFDNWQQFQDAKKLFPFSLWDEFPHYLVYSAIGFDGDWMHRFPLKFDIARTKAKNGPLWDNTVAKVQLKFVKVDSEETDGQDGYGKNAVDGDPNTYWHTQWQGNSPPLPHEIIIELIPPSIIKGFTCLPRQDESDHGTIKDYEFYVSNNGKDFGSPVKKGTFEPGKEEKIETFAPVKCRFIKLKAISEINGQPWTSAAEIGVIQNDEDVSAMTNPINQATSLLAEFEKEKSTDKLQAAYVAVGNIPEPGADKTVPKTVARQEKARMLFNLLAVIDQNIDPSFDDPHNPENQIFLNLVPPPTPEGIRYPSGVDPNDIKDPKTRAQYEAAIKQNNDKILRANFQTRLHNINQSANIFAESFLRHNYTTSKEDQSELENLMQQAELSPARMQKLKAFFEPTKPADNSVDPYRSKP